MSALRSNDLRAAAVGATASELPLRGRARFALWRMLTSRGVRQNFLILTVFWVYVALSNVLYTKNMQASFSAWNHDFMGYAPSFPRLLQHLFLYPVLLGCIWMSTIIGWQPLWRKLSLQLALAVFFALLADPALGLGVYLGADAATLQKQAAEGEHWWDPSEGPILIASAITFLLAYVFALTLVTGFAFYQRLRDAQLRSSALERQLSAAHLAALRMQLSPHTLFNLLHTIRGQISWDPVTAQSMVVQLGDLLRRLLTAGERDFSLLEDELHFVRLYLGLQQRRFADRLSIRVPESGSVVDAWVPSLILQPLVENAVVHGLAGHDGHVMVRVEAVVHDEMLSLRVVNTIARGAVSGRPGIGLRNVRERIAIQFGDRATFSATPGYDNVWIAEVRLPLLRDGPAVPARAWSGEDSRASHSVGSSSVTGRTRRASTV